jgi:hypothetical protein
LYSFVVLCETNVLNLISQRLDTICQIKPKRATVHFSPFSEELNTPKSERQLAVASARRPEALPATPGSIPGDRGIPVHSARERGEKGSLIKKINPKGTNVV